MLNRNCRALIIALGASASWMALATASHAQDAETGTEVGEVIVTATRRAENIQDVPLTVTAVSGKELQDLNIFTFDDVDVLVPGLELTSSSGFGASASLRGVGFNSQASTSPAVDIYFNETPLDANYAFQSIYDVGQIEVLRGPQGTLRGRPAPAGAVTIASRRPNLSELGGTASLSLSDQNAVNAWAAINVPLIKDRLAMRVAVIRDENDGDRVRNFAGDKSSNKTDSWRASLRFVPTDNIDINLSYQDLQTDRVSLSEVQGPGLFGLNGPAITQRGRSAQVTPNTGLQEAKITTLSATWDLGSNRIVYTGGYQDMHFQTKNQQDPGNIAAIGAALGFTYVPGVQTVDSFYEQSTHELRFESTGDRFMDYVVGYWRLHSATHTPGNQLVSSFAPALGSVFFTVDTNSTDQALFGNLVFHLSDRTELSVGARYLENVSVRGDVLEIPAFFLTASRPANVVSREGVYTASLSHHFTDDVMGYATYGHSWRPGGVTVANTSPTVGSQFIFAPPEESDSYELGVKSEWFDKSVRVNAAVYRQDFTNFVSRFEGINYDNPSSPGGFGTGGFSFGADAVVSGAEVELAWDVTERWNVQLNMFTADGHFDNAQVLCNDSNNDGLPDTGIPAPGSFDPGGISTCVSNGAISSTPNWGATLQSEFTFPVFGLEGYLRGLYTYAPENHNFRADEGFTRESYGILNLYTGVRGVDQNWEIGLWAKNLLDDDTVYSQAANNIQSSGIDTGYRSISYVPAREAGVSLRYSFGGG